MNTNKLAGKIRECELSQKDLATALNLSERSMSLRMTSKISFRLSEAETVAKILHLTDDEITSIFFN